MVKSVICRMEDEPTTVQAWLGSVARSPGWRWRCSCWRWSRHL